ncbi:Gfo/Idh/MocA family protein [Streptomyces sp. CA-135486]|uniref:Gfo/Idh/MocA family protein n=1 Tax=Streptomyces sp. CA-135486 TaxID=3240049 RepID=UPI003D8BD38D
MTVRIGIIGCGGISAFAHLPGIQASDPSGAPAEVVSLCDLDENRSNLLRERYRLTSARIASSREILADPTVDAIIVASWPSAHTESALAAIRAGKHVLLQKPVALSAAEAEELVKATEESRRNILALPLIGHLPGVGQLKKIITKRALGRLAFFRIRVSVPGPEDYHQDIRNFFGEDDGKTDSVLRPEYAGGSGCAGDLGPYALAVIHDLFGSCRLKAVHKSSAAFEKSCLLLLEARDPHGDQADPPFLCSVELGWNQFPSEELCVVAGRRGTATLSPAGAVTVRPDSSLNSDTQLQPGYSILPPSPIAAQQLWLNAILKDRKAAFHDSMSVAAWTARVLEEVRISGADQ